MSRHWALALPLWLALALAALVLGSAVGAEPSPQEMALNPDGAAYEINAGTGGLMWISDNRAGEIWAVNPATGVYTTYSGAGQASDARPAADGTVWWVDQASDALGHLSPASGETTLWHIPVATTLFGTAIDGLGQIWVTESSRPHLFRLSPAAGELCTYTLAAAGGSDYVLAQGSQIWLGDPANDRIRRLDADSGILTSWALPGNAQPEGLALGPDGYVWWTDPDLHYLGRLQPDLARLTTYPLPYGSAPEMIAASGNRLWYTEDGDGTVGRMDPWLVHGSSQSLVTGTVALNPSCAEVSPAATGELTMSTGTAAWAGASYTRTVGADGWLIYQLPSGAFPWGMAASGGAVWVVDTGRQALARLADEPSASACKLFDGDGVLATGDDQVPAEGWTVYLTVDGVRQEPGQLTRATGCYTWDDLEAGLTYGVEEDLPAGWTPLTPTSHSLGQIGVAQAFGYSFINAENASVTACKLADGDGSLDTTEDRTLLEGWTVYLTVDGVRQEPGQTTGADGCATWSNLTPAQSYGAEEEMKPGWKALTPTSIQFGQALSGADYRAEFINSRGRSSVFLPLIVRP